MAGHWLPAFNLLLFRVKWSPESIYKRISPAAIKPKSCGVRTNPFLDVSCANCQSPGLPGSSFTIICVHHICCRIHLGPVRRSNQKQTEKRLFQKNDKYVFSVAPCIHRNRAFRYLAISKAFPISPHVILTHKRLSYN